VQTDTIILKGQHQLVALLLQRDRDGACFPDLPADRRAAASSMPCATALRSRCSKAGSKPVQHAAVHLGGATPNIQSHLLAQLFGRLAYRAVQTLRHHIELNHAGSQQVPLQFTRLAPLGNQIVFGTLHRALHAELHA